MRQETASDSAEPVATVPKVREDKSNPNPEPHPNPNPNPNPNPTRPLAHLVPPWMPRPVAGTNASTVVVYAAPANFSASDFLPCEGRRKRILKLCLMEALI